MYARQITSEQTYTLAEAKHIINAERSQKREVFFNKAKQKLLGILALGAVVAEFALGYANIIDEGGAFIFMLPVGIWLLLKKD